MVNSKLIFLILKDEIVEKVDKKYIEGEQTPPPVSHHRRDEANVELVFYYFGRKPMRQWNNTL